MEKEIINKTIQIRTFSTIKEAIINSFATEEVGEMENTIRAVKRCEINGFLFEEG